MHRCLWHLMNKMDSCVIRLLSKSSIKFKVIFKKSFTIFQFILCWHKRRVTNTAAAAAGSLFLPCITIRHPPHPPHRSKCPASRKSSLRRAGKWTNTASPVHATNRLDICPRAATPSYITSPLIFLYTTLPPAPFHFYAKGQGPLEQMQMARRLSTRRSHPFFGATYTLRVFFSHQRPRKGTAAALLPYM